MDVVLRFQLLGAVRAWRGERELDVGPAKQRAVLAILLLHSGRPVSTARIVEAVWPDDPPENGANTVQKYVAGLRRVLDPDRPPRSPEQLLTLTEGGYTLRVAADAVDVDVFQQRVGRAHAAGDRKQLAEAATELCGALALWHGEPLAGLSGHVFDAIRAKLIEGRAAALERWAELELQLGHHREIVAELVRLVGEFPLREQLRALQMTALYRCGRQAEALAAFRDVRALLHNGYGIEPGAALQELHRQILRSDPALAAPPPDTDPRPAAGPAAVAPQSPQVLPASWWTPPPSAAETGRRAWVAWLETAVCLAVVLGSFGVLTWAVILYYAGRRRSWWLGLATVGYVGMIAMVVLALEFTDPVAESATVLDGVIVLGLLVAWGGGGTHVVLLNERLGIGRARRPPSTAQQERRACREQARYLLHYHPSARRDLGIGRPDLPRVFDDGGLIDVNSVPEAVLTQLPAMTPQLARHIAVDRDHRGWFRSMDDLSARCLLPLTVADALREIALFLPPEPALAEHGAADG